MQILRTESINVTIVYNQLQPQTDMNRWKTRAFTTGGQKQHETPVFC